MEKIGEGEKIWIMEDRPERTNVHNWHWSETDCLELSRNLLTKLLSDQTVLNGEGNLYIKTKKVDKVEGEAYVNIRKGKIILGCPISLILSWESEAKDADDKSLLWVDRTVKVTYISDENANEDPEIKVLCKDDGPVGKRLKEVFLVKGKAFVLEQIRFNVAAHLLSK